MGNKSENIHKALVIQYDCCVILSYHYYFSQHTEAASLPISKKKRRSQAWLLNVCKLVVTLLHRETERDLMSREDELRGKCVG